LKEIRKKLGSPLGTGHLEVQRSEIWFNSELKAQEAAALPLRIDNGRDLGQGLRGCREPKSVSHGRGF
jgi:hypothetical protein